MTPTRNCWRASAGANRRRCASWSRASSRACWPLPSECSAGAAKPRKWRRTRSFGHGARRATGSPAGRASTPGCTGSSLNLCHDRLRARRDTEPYDEAQHAAADGAALPDEALQVKERGRRVADALARLPTRQREALVLQYYQDLSNGEAAALMEISIEALESLLARARRNLRAQLMSQAEEKP